MKSLVLIFSCACVALVLSEAGGVFLLWKGGLLTSHHLQEIRLVFTAGAAEAWEDAESRAKPQASLQEVTQSRAVKVLDLEKRESELNVLKSMANSKKGDLNLEQEAFRAQKKAFEEELARLDAAVTSAATEQARGVLLALPTKEAMEKLMKLTVPESIVLLKGMPEKSLANILKEFKGTAEQMDRGREIFEAICRGAPTREFLDDTSRKFNTGAAPLEKEEITPPKESTVKQ